MMLSFRTAAAPWLTHFTSLQKMIGAQKKFVVKLM
jgi:hypothetical protein